jgi:hypothetical protein
VRAIRLSGGALLAFGVLAATVLALAGRPASALAAPGPWWHVTSSVRPSTLPSGGEGSIVAQAINAGDAPTSGPVSFSLDLPAGVSVVEDEGVPQVSLFLSSLGFEFDFGPVGFGFLELCEVSSAHVTCNFHEIPGGIFEPEGLAQATLAPYEDLEMRVKVKDEAGVSGSAFTTAVSGGGGSPVSRDRPLAIGEEPPRFGTEDLTLVPEEEGGAIDTHAGSHPFQLTTTFNLNQSADPARPAALPKDLHFELPPGQLGNVTPLPKCTAAQFTTNLSGSRNLCPPNTVLGAATVTIVKNQILNTETVSVPIFNLEPKFGEPARFGFMVYSSPVVLDTSVRSGPGEDYGVTVSASSITQATNFIASTLTFWGAPGDPRHDQSRGWECLTRAFWIEAPERSEIPCNPSSQSEAPAFLTLPTNCSAPFTTTVEGNSWPNKDNPEGASLGPSSYSLEDAFGDPLGLIGCNKLAFDPSVQAEPTTNSASSPSGLDFNLDFHDEGLTNQGGTAQSQLKDTVVTLPEGFTINPSAGVGLGGCTEADYARESVDSPAGAGCPNDSKLGTVEIETPLLTQKILGSIFIAQPYENPSGSLVALYIVAKSPETGILIKLAGKVTPNPVTGQLVTTFENNPQLPFDHFNFHFREGQRAPLISPSTCGSYAIQAQLTPWAEPTAALTRTSSFTITSGAEGGACPSGGAPPFSPEIQAGTLNNSAGAFSSFYLHLSRKDSEQEISAFSTSFPAGLSGDLTGVPFCPDADIALARGKSGAQEEAEPSCPGATRIGHTLVGTGVGAVLAYVPGKVYFAGPYNGDPFSIVAVTSAVVGPFDLGTVVIRFGLRIDPLTAQVSVDPTASEPIPTIIKGIVTHVRDIRVYIDRPNFIVNPTSCAPSSIGSTLKSSLGASATIASPFQAANCANLKFAPKFAVSTNGRTSKAQGASLTVKLTYPSGSFGTAANIARVKVDLPKQLPSRLTTLQQACTAAQFEASPAGCPAASIVGHAKALTPLLPVPLEGPAYFVSHGGEAFPSLIMVLRGYGVTIDLVGTTFIRNGVTSSTFKSVPDQPVSSFELSLPQGKFSALAANGNLCKSKLAMPTEFVAQNGVKINRSTPVGVTGCARKAITRKQKLAAALKKCHTRTKRDRRVTCEKQARRRYAVKKRGKSHKG